MPTALPPELKIMEAPSLTPGLWRVITSLQACRNFVTREIFPDVFPQERDWREQMATGASWHLFRLKAIACKGESHVLVYFLRRFQNPIKDSGFVDELRISGSEQQGVLARRSAFRGVCLREPAQRQSHWGWRQMFPGKRAPNGLGRCIKMRKIRSCAGRGRDGSV